MNGLNLEPYQSFLWFLVKLISLNRILGSLMDVIYVKYMLQHQIHALWWLCLNFLDVIHATMNYKTWDYVAPSLAGLP